MNARLKIEEINPLILGIIRADFASNRAFHFEPAGSPHGVTTRMKMPSAGEDDPVHLLCPVQASLRRRKQAPQAQCRPVDAAIIVRNLRQEDRKF